MAHSSRETRPTGTGSIHGFDQVLWRGFFLIELAVAAVIVFGVGVAALGSAHDLWSGALFCFSVVLALLIDAAVKKWIFHRPPMLSPIFSVLVGIMFTAMGVGLGWVSSH